MSVLKAKRKPSPFEVEHNLNKVRTVVTELALNKFGLKEYQEKPKPQDYYKWSDQQKAGYDGSVAKRRQRYESFVEWFIPDEQKEILNLIRKLVCEVYLANDITMSASSSTIADCDGRRFHQSLALGYCDSLIQELQYVISTLYVDVEKYESITKLILLEKELIKGWRKSDNKIRRQVIDRIVNDEKQRIVYANQLNESNVVNAE